MLKIAKKIVSKFRTDKNPAPIFFEDDVFLVSYPKSGNTWLRFLIGNYLSDNNYSFLNAHLIIPDLDFNPSAIIDCARPRIIKSHHPSPQSYKRVVYLVRDGRDVAVSYYYHLKKFRLISNSIEFQDYLLRFINGTLDGYGPWGNHVQDWVNNDVGDFIIIRYEDLKEAPLPTLKRVIEFCGHDVNEDNLVRAIAASGVKEMQAMEKAQQKDLERMVSSDSSMLFVRKGDVGDWRDHFDEPMLALFLESFGTTLSDQRYL